MISVLDVSFRVLKDQSRTMFAESRCLFLQKLASPTRPKLKKHTRKPLLNAALDDGYSCEQCSSNAKYNGADNFR